MRSLGATIDDAAGEAYDKVARVLGLPFPGGPPIDRAAAGGRPGRDQVPARQAATTARSTSPSPGLKTAVARWVEARQDAGEPVPVADVAASFQEAVADVLTRKAVAGLPRARRHRPGDRRRRGGQLPAARAGRGALRRRPGIRLRVPSPGLCTDNGAMVAALGAELVAAGRPRPPLDLPADSSLPVTEVLVP